MQIFQKLFSPNTLLVSNCVPEVPPPSLLTHAVCRLSPSHHLTVFNEACAHVWMGFDTCQVLWDMRNSKLLQLQGKDTHTQKNWFLTHIMVTFTATTGTSGSCPPSQSSSRSWHRQSSGTAPSTGETRQRRPVAVFQLVIECVKSGYVEKLKFDTYSTRWIWPQHCSWAFQNTCQRDEAIHCCHLEI